VKFSRRDCDLCERYHSSVVRCWHARGAGRSLYGRHAESGAVFDHAMLFINASRESAGAIGQVAQAFDELLQIVDHCCYSE
jgi:hypothetical protein